jgi:phosphatidate cytidylyltransferase
VLIARVLTAIALLAVLIPVVFAGQVWLWGVVSLALLVIAFGEWSRLVAGAKPSLVEFSAVLVCGLALISVLPHGGLPQPLLIAVCFPAGLFWLIEAPRRLRAHQATMGRRTLAVWLLAACWIALYQLRGQGAAVLVAAMAIVWVADIAAYFAGRAFGRHKLAPTISPGKSWEGAVAGMVGVAVLGVWSASWPGVSDTLPALLVNRLGGWMAALVLVLLAGLSIVGDLYESLLKRQAGVKDSGRLLPGHGGALDRIDALIPTMPVVALLHELLR